MSMILKRRNYSSKPHTTEFKKYKHVIGNNGEDIQEYSSSRSYVKTFGKSDGETYIGKNGKPYFKGNPAKSPYMQKLLQETDAHKTNNDIMRTDFKRGNYLKGLKHGLYVSGSTREKFRNEQY